MTSESSTAVVVVQAPPPPPVQTSNTNLVDSAGLLVQQSSNGHDPASPAPSTASSSSVSSASQSPLSASCTGSPPSHNLHDHHTVVSVPDVSPVIVNGTASSVIVRVEKSISPITDLTLPDRNGGVQSANGSRRILVDATTLAKTLQACAGHSYEEKLKCLDDLSEQIFKLKEAIVRTATPVSVVTSNTSMSDDGEDLTRDVGCCPRWSTNGEVKLNNNGHCRSPTPTPTSKQNGRRSHSNHGQTPYANAQSDVSNVRNRDQQQQILNSVKSELMGMRSEKMNAATVFPDAMDDDSLIKCAQVCVRLGLVWFVGSWTGCANVYCPAPKLSCPNHLDPTFCFRRNRQRRRDVSSSFDSNNIGFSNNSSECWRLRWPRRPLQLPAAAQRLHLRLRIRPRAHFRPPYWPLIR